MSEQKEIFITKATIKKPDGTVERLSNKQAQALIHTHEGDKIQLPDGDATIEWIEGTPKEFLAIHGIVI